ncbi:MAG: SLC13 family permease [Chiayiivirga sp.]|jgi:di/tricarboxylate transporter|uniref:SLC13 family permease n=1 Tax=Chiayiivirga sp. TaxID=2041042 RepID=UPI0025C21FF8|nr:SLC13 family permease [Chiayiivirga sp.]MCI1711943.1 SLC13 family permease [Chiayiivirga sp.]MCI1729463.1 SLC13 family permease [Chiayiivirga sp.]
MDSGLNLTTEMMLVLGLVAFTMVMFTWERLRPDVTALLVLVTLGLSGLIPADRLFDGFAGSAVISVIATMILGAGLDRTGLLNRLAGWLLRRSRGLEERLILLHALFAGLVSSVMQNPSVTALFLPVASRLSARTGVTLARLLLPMAVCVIMGGSLTMVGSSPLILLNDLLAAANDHLPSGVATLEPLAMFAPAPVGAALLLLGLAYFRLFGRRMLGGVEDKSVVPARTESYFARTYGIEGEVFELTVTAESPLVGMSIGEAEASPGAPLLLALKSGNESRLAPPADQMIWVGSVLGVMGKREHVADYAEAQSLRLQSRLRNFGDLFNPSRAGISEAVVPPTSRFIGQTLDDLRLRKRLGISVLAINRGNEVHREDIRRLPLRAGDMLVYHSIWRDLAQAAESRDFVVVTDYPKDEQRPHKLWVALIVFGLALALALSNQVAVPVALMAGVIGMLLTGVLDMDEAYAAINWKTVFIMACLIPLGWAVDSSGTASWIAEGVMERLDGFPIWALQVAIGLITMLLGLVISHVGATVIMVPMAINIAVSAGANPIEFALIVALCASNNLISVSNPVLAMITGPAGFRGWDLMRVGLPLSLLYIALATGMVNLVF